MFVLFSTSACIKVSIKDSFDGGIFKTIDGGNNWIQRNKLLKLDEQENFLSNLDISVLIFDPQDNKTLYLGTKKNGAFVSFNSGKSWQEITNFDDTKAINSIVVDPQFKHIVYLSSGNKIFRTNDANRTWHRVYLEAMSGVEINSMAIDASLPYNIYAGLSDGRLIKSENNGVSWKNIYNFQSRIKQILIDGDDTKKMYIVTLKHGLFLSSDSGTTWQSLSKGLKEFNGSNDIYKLIFSPSEENTIISANKYGLLKSSDNGMTWSSYKLLLSGKKMKVYSVGVDAVNSDIIYYLTKTALHLSVDNGINWTVKPLPSKRIPSKLLVDSVDSSILYLGFIK